MRILDSITNSALYIASRSLTTAVFTVVVIVGQQLLLELKRSLMAFSEFCDRKGLEGFKQSAETIDIRPCVRFASHQRRSSVPDMIGPKLIEIL